MRNKLHGQAPPEPWQGPQGARSSPAVARTAGRPRFGSPGSAATAATASMRPSPTPSPASTRGAAPPRPSRRRSGSAARSRPPPRSATPAARRRPGTRRRIRCAAAMVRPVPAASTPTSPMPATTAAGATRARIRSARWSTKWAIRLPCIAVSGTSSGARVSVTARMTTPPVAPRSPDVALSSTGKPITRMALAPAAAIECDAPRRNVDCATRGQQPGRHPRRRGGDQHDQPCDRAGHGGPEESGQAPARPAKVAVATTTRMPGIGHHQRPVLRSTGSRPASMPSSVACRQKPASPTASSATLTAIAIRRTRGPTTAAS